MTVPPPLPEGMLLHAASKNTANRELSFLSGWMDFMDFLAFIGLLKVRNAERAGSPLSTSLPSEPAGPGKFPVAVNDGYRASGFLYARLIAIRVRFNRISVVILQIRRS